MHIDIGIIVVFVTAFIGTQGWQIGILFKLSQKVTRLETQIEGLPCSDCGKRPVKIRHHLPVLAGLLAATLLTLAISGCTTGLRAKGGSMTHHAGQTITSQPENPKDGAAQKTAQHHAVELPLPAGSTIQLSRPDGILTNSTAITLGGGSVYREWDSDETDSSVGASQTDITGQVVAKLRATRWLTIFGAIVFLAGLALAFYPALTLIMGGKTPGLAIAGGGLILAFLPFIIIGNERLLMGLGMLTGVVALALVWIHHHGGIAAELAALKKTFSGAAPTAQPASASSTSASLAGAPAIKTTTTTETKP